MDARFPLQAINLNHFLVLDAFFRHRSGREVALELGVSPSAVSHALKEIRRQFDDPMFTRGPNGFEPTPKAQNMRPHISLALDSLSEVLRKQSTFNPQTCQGHWTIATANEVAPSYLPCLVDKLAARAPGIVLDFRWRANSAETLLSERSADLVFQLSQTVPSWAQRQPLYQDSMVVVMARNHPFPHAHMDLEQYCSLRHVRVSPEGFGSSSVDDGLKEQGLLREIPVYCVDFLSAMEIVVASHAIATVPARLAHSYARRGLVRVLESPLGSSDFQVDLVWHQGRANAQLRWLVEQITDTFAKHPYCEHAHLPAPTPQFVPTPEVGLTTGP